MDNRAVVWELVRWIEERLGGELPPPLLAARAGYSLQHFSRLFAAVVGIPPAEYVLKRRVARAAALAARGKGRFTDIALECGFRDLEGLSKAFARELGVSPSAYRKGARLRDPHVLPASMPLLAPEVGLGRAREVELSALRLVGLAVSVAAEEEGKVGALWARFPGLLPAIGVDPAAARFRQLAFWDEEDQCRITIMACVEIPGDAPIEAVLPFQSVSLPPSRYAVFTHVGPARVVGRAYATLYGAILPLMEARLTKPWNLELYDQRCAEPESPDAELDIYVPLG